MISFRVSNLVVFSFHFVCILANRKDSNNPDNLHGNGQSLFPSFQYYPFKYHRNYVPNNFQPPHYDNQRLLEPIFRRPLFKNARQLLNYNEPTMIPRLLDRSDESGSSERTSDTFNAPNFSIMRGGTFLEDDRSGEDFNFGKFQNNFNGGYRPSSFSEEAESSSYRKPVYQQFDGFRDFADLSLPTSSKLVYKYTSAKSAPDTGIVKSDANVINDGCEPEKKLSKSRFKQKLESENRKLLTKSNVKMKIIHSKMLFNNNTRSQSQSQ